jgi:hypothetical protein
MNGTFVVISNPSDPTFPFIGFQEVGTDPVLAFDTTGTSLAALPGQKPYGLDTAFDEIMLDVLLPNLGSPFDETLVNNGGHFTISELDASFQATTASSNVPEPGTLALLSLVLGAATLSLHRNRGSRMRLSDQ